MDDELTLRVELVDGGSDAASGGGGMPSPNDPQYFQKLGAMQGQQQFAAKSYATTIANQWQGMNPAPTRSSFGPDATASPASQPSPTTASFAMPPASEFEQRYGKNFKTAADVLRFWSENGREPTPDDRADAVAPSGASVLSVDAGVSAPPSLSPQEEANAWMYSFGQASPYQIHPPKAAAFAGLPPGMSTPNGAQVDAGMGGSGGGGGGRKRRGGAFADDDGGDGSWTFNNPGGEEPEGEQSYWDRFRDAVSGPATKYGVNSASYVIGGAVGRATTPAIGVMAGGATRGILSAGVSAGLITNPALIAIAGTAIAATAVSEAFQKLTQTADELARDFSKVNGPIAATMALNQASNLQQDIYLASQSENALIPYLDAQNDFYQEWRAFTTQITNTFLPLATNVLDSLASALYLYNAYQQAMKDAGLDTSEMFKLIPSIGNIERWIKEIMAFFSSTNPNQAVDDFLNPKTYSSQNPNNPFFPFQAPPQKKPGVF